jgi:hypothetical protein
MNVKDRLIVYFPAVRGKKILGVLGRKLKLILTEKYKYERIIKCGGNMNYRKTIISFFMILTIVSVIFGQEVDEMGRGYEFELGKYNILQYRANIREKPDRSSDVIAILSLHDEIEILENTWEEEKINNVWAYWVKIRYGNITGYTFGGNIAIKKLITDIDKNGINDYFYFRSSDASSVVWKIDTYNDIIIYINNKKIETTRLITDYDDEHYKHILDWCEFEGGNNYVLIKLFDFEKEITNTYTYTLYKNGTIEFIGKERSW